MKHSNETVWTRVDCWISSGAQPPDEAKRADAVPWTVLLGYDPADPWAIALRFAGAQQWLVARDMLAIATCGRVDHGGDVWMQPDDGGEVRVALSSPTGRATVWLSARDVNAVLQRSWRVVPYGQEADRINWDWLLTGDSS